MPIKSAKVNKIDTEIIRDMHVDVEEHPKKIIGWFSHNIIDRVLAYLVGLGDDDKFHIMHVDANGNIKVISALEDYTDYYATSVDIGSGGSASIDFPKNAREIMIQTGADKWTLNIKKTNGQYGDNIDFMFSGNYSFNISCSGVKITNNATDTERYVIIAKW